MTTTTMAQPQQNHHPQHSHQDNASLEYWTNGKTTHLLALPTADAVRRKTRGSTPSSLPAPLLATQTPAPRPQPLQQQFTKSPSRQEVVRNSLIAGSLSGMVSTVTLYPLDVLRTKMQAAVTHAGSSTTGRAPSGPLHVLYETVRWGGLRALYTGLVLPLAAQVVYKSTIFTVHNVTQAWIRDARSLERAKLGQPYRRPSEIRLSYADTAVTGFTAGAVNAGCFVTPVELVRNQMIAQDSRLAAAQQGSTGTRGASKLTTWDVLRGTIRNHGVARLWRGLGVTVARDGIGVAAFFCTKRAVETYLNPPSADARPTLGTTLLSGALAGLSFWVVSLPLDTVKTWIQSGPLDRPPVNVWAELQQTYHQRDGPSAVGKRLLRGWQVAYTRGMPSAALTIATYSAVYRALEENREG